MDIERLLQTIVQAGASDLHLAVGNPPVARVNGDLKMVQANGPLTAEDMEGVLRAVTTPEKVASFHEEKELDFSYGRQGLARFRVNACYQRGSLSLSFRILPAEIPTTQELGLPASGLDFVKQLRGLVLVTGPTGSGKSTTVAALLNHINETTSCRIITIEDPIEFVHPNKRSMIIQREIGGDTLSFAESLRRALRQDPDVIMVGEMRDLETVSLALTAAETGHLVLGTLHTNGAAESIERLVGIHPPEQQQQVQFQLSIGISGVVYQSLMPMAGGKGRGRGLRGAGGHDGHQESDPDQPDPPDQVLHVHGRPVRHADAGAVHGGSAQGGQGHRGGVLRPGSRPGYSGEDYGNWRGYPSPRTSSPPRHWPARPRSLPDPVCSAVQVRICETGLFRKTIPWCIIRRTCLLGLPIVSF